MVDLAQSLPDSLDLLPETLKSESTWVFGGQAWGELMYKEERKFVEKEGKLANCLLTLRESCVLTEPSPSTNCSTRTDLCRAQPEEALAAQSQPLALVQPPPAYRGDLCMSSHACTRTRTQGQLTRRHSRTTSGATKDIHYKMSPEPQGPSTSCYLFPGQRFLKNNLRT